MANGKEAFDFNSARTILETGDPETAAAEFLRVTGSVEGLIGVAKAIARQDGKRAQEVLQSQAVQNRIVPDHTYDDSEGEHLWIPNFASDGQMLESDFRRMTFNLLKVA